MAARHQLSAKQSLLLANSPKSSSRRSRTLEKYLFHLSPNKQRRLEPIPLLPIQLQQLQQHRNKSHYPSIPIRHRHQYPLPPQPSTNRRCYKPTVPAQQPSPTAKYLPPKLLHKWHCFCHNATQFPLNSMDITKYQPTIWLQWFGTIQ